MRIDRVGFFQDVADALVGGRQRGGFGQCGEGTHGCQAVADIAQALRTQGQHGIDFLRAVALLAQLASEAVVDEIGQRAFHRLGPQRCRKGLHRCGDQGAERQRGRLLAQHADDAQRMPPQRKRVLVAGRQVTDAEHAHQGFQLVGQRHHHAGVVARQRVAGKTRLVVVFNRVGHLGA